MSIFSEKKIKTILFYFIPFCTGLVLLSYEILCFRLFAPNLGSSIYVYTSILGFTLAGLMAGYFFSGNYLTKKTHLILILILVCIYLFFSKEIIHATLSKTFDMSIKSASVVGGLLFVFLPMSLMGMISPLLINISPETEKFSRTGLVYGISTMGGVIGVMVIVFFLIPNFGLSTSCKLLAVIEAISLITFFSVKYDK